MVWNYFAVLLLAGHNSLLQSIGENENTPSSPAISSPEHHFHQSQSVTSLKFTPPHAIQGMDILSEMSSQAVCAFSHGGCIYLSSAWEGLTGFPVEGESANRLFFSYIHHDYAERLNATLLHALAEESGLGKKCSFQMQVSGGEYRWFELHFVRRLAEEDGEITLYALLSDINEVTHLRQMATTATRETVEALRTRETFLAGVSHELRTPLNAILGFAEMMQNGVLGEISNARYLEYITHIKESGEDLLGSIDAMLEEAHLEPPARMIGDESGFTALKEALKRAQSQTAVFA